MTFLWNLKEAKMVRTLGLAGALLAVSLTLHAQNAVSPISTTISVLDATTGQQVTQGEKVKTGDQFQIMVTIGGFCSGAFVLTSWSTSGSSAAQDLDAVVPYIVTSSSGGTVVSTVFPSSIPQGLKFQDEKISTSCDGTEIGQFGFARFEFFFVP